MVLLNAMRRRMDTLEEKLSTQITHFQQQSDKNRDATLARVDMKMNAMEVWRPNFERRVCELSGQAMGLSDETHALIRKVDQMDARFTSWRHQLEEEIRGKFTEVDTKLQQMASDLRVQNMSGEDALKRHHRRVLRLEGLVEERLSTAEPSSNHAESPCKASEGEEPQTAASSSRGVPCSNISLIEASRHMQGVQGDQEAEEQTRSGALSARRLPFANVSGGEDPHRLRGMEQRARNLSRGAATHRGLQHEAAVDKRGEATYSGLHQRLAEAVKKLEVEEHAARPADINLGIEADDAVSLAAVTAAVSQSTASLAAAVKDCTHRLRELEHRCSGLDVKLEDVSYNSEIESRVEKLVEYLQDVSKLAPKVMANEEHIREVAEKLGQVARRMPTMQPVDTKVDTRGRAENRIGARPDGRR